MLKDIKNISIAILIVIVIISSMILIAKIITGNKKKEIIDRKISNQEENVTKVLDMKKQENRTLLSNEEKQNGMNELSEMMKNKTDKCVLIINGEEVSEKEIAYVNFQKNSEVLHKGQEKKNIISEIIKEYIIDQDARDKGIFLSDEENREIEESVKKNFQKNSNEMNIILDATHMKYEDFVKFYTSRMKRLEVQTKWSLYITDAIKNGELNTENNEFNEKCQKCKKYAEDKEMVSQAVKLLFELIEEYKELLKQKAEIEYMN